MKKVNCEVKEAKKAVKEAREAYYKSIRDWNEIECNIDFTGYLPKEIPEEVIKDILKKSPNMPPVKLAYELACHYWRVVCATDTRCIAAGKAIDDARKVLRAKEEVLNSLQTV